MGNSILNRIYSDEKVVPPNMKWKAIEIEEYRRIYEDSIKDPVRFWEHEALKLKWEEMWSKAIDGHPPKNIWFKDGMINTYHNIIGKHEDKWIWFKPAIIWESEDEDVKVITYEELNRVVERLSGALKSLGINSDEWMTFYTPPMMESIALMLASIRMGIPFEPIFTGFSYGEVAKRVLSRKPKIIVTTDGFMRRGKIVNTLDNIRKALNSTGYKCNVIVIERIGSKGLLKNEISYEKFMELSNTKTRDYIASSQHKLFGLHTAYEEDFKPITHSVGGYLTQVYATSRWIGLRPHDTYFCTVWPGWITGVSYVVFGPLMIGSTIVLYEGSIDYPSWDRLWSIIERYAVTIFLTTGGALRLLSKNDASYVRSHNMDTLRAILVTADPLDVDTWIWTYKTVGTGYTPTINSIPEKLTGRIPVISMYIQSEIGTFITGSLINYTFTPLIP
ncbi:MAG: AMP-binding protein, partial [Candidatus Methanomethylicia archaeon]